MPETSAIRELCPHCGVNDIGAAFGFLKTTKVCLSCLYKGSPQMVRNHLFEPLFRSAGPWECPRCGIVNAPHASQCRCKPEKPGDA